MRAKITLLSIVTFAAAAAWAAEDLKPFDFSVEKPAIGTSVQALACSFPNLQLPKDFAVFATGAYGGRKTTFQIDQSGHEATQIDVAVNSPSKPVVLILGAYEPTIWNVGWSRGTKIAAVLVSGYHRQVIAGLETPVPVLNSSYDNRGPCGHFYVSRDSLEALNPKSRSLFGRPVDMVYFAQDGKAVVGDPLPEGAKLVTSPITPPESFYDKTAPLAGPAGLEDMVKKGFLRKATPADAQEWSDAMARSNPNRDVPPVAGQGVPAPRRPGVYNGYVVLKPITFPSGLYGAHSATFFVPKGVPRPQGDAGHSTVYDFNSLACAGVACGR